MNCPYAETLIQAGVDGELSLAEREVLDTHLASCLFCRQSWDAQRRLAQIASHWARPTAADDPGEAFTAAVLAQIVARPETASRRLSSPVWLPLAVLFCLGAAFALLPTVSLSGFSTLTQSAQLLPHWLLSNLHALPGDTLAVLHASPSVAVPRCAWAVLLLVIALNSVFCVHARRGLAQRSFS